MKKIILKKTKFKDLLIGDLKGFKDDRGSFYRLFCSLEIKKFLGNKKILQINLSKNKRKGTTRGLHYQKRPFGEKKIVICINGTIQDYVVDLRKKSKTFLKIFKIKLSEKNNKVLLIPEGFAHGFQTLSNNSDVLYFHTQVYKKKFENSLNFQDPILKINMKINKESISKKDLDAKFLNKKFIGLSF